MVLTQAVVAEEVLIQRNQRLDVWDEANKSSTLPVEPELKLKREQEKKDEQRMFRNNLLKVHNIRPKNGSLTCMITGCLLPSALVTAAHVFPKKGTKKMSVLKNFGLDLNDIVDARNGILMAQNIEKAYDAKDVCFAPDPLHLDRLLLTVLNPSIMNNRIADTPNALTFRDVNHRYMKLSKDPKRVPFLRILSFHYGIAMAAAYEKNWIKQKDVDAIRPYDDRSPNYKARVDLLNKARVTVQAAVADGLILFDNIDNDDEEKLPSIAENADGDD